MDGKHVLEAAGACQALLGAAVDRDWTRRLPHLDFPWAPADADPWAALLWANGRIDLPGRQRQVDWRWHCAPLEEWDGLNPAGRR